MKGRVRLIAVIDLAFILLISAVGFLGGWPYQAARVGVYLLLVVLGLVAARKLSYLQAGGGEIKSALKIRGGDLLLTLPVAAPAVALVFGTSALTTLVLTSLGAEGTGVADAPFLEMLIAHALLPAILEEGLFRLLPLVLLGRKAPGLCIIISAVFFAFIHCNLFTLPYALVAGAVFMAADIACDSAIPSLILHLVNNTLSVVWMKYCDTPTRVGIFLVSLGSAVVISLGAAFLLKGKYKLAFSRIFRKNEGLDRQTLAAEVIRPGAILVGVCAVMAFMNLFF